MQSKARKLCFEGQEIIKALITSLQFMEEKGCYVIICFILLHFQ